jgi:predicted nucleotidyltransferase
MTDFQNVFEERANYSRSRLEEVSATIANLEELKAFDGLTVFSAGSFARYEASEYSDIDMFFLCMNSREGQIEPHTKELKLFGKMIDVVDKLSFPKFSGDCKYLNILNIDEILKHLGSPTDDHMNYFTARMLLLLESKCLFGEDVYKNVISNIVRSYFVDYPDHSETFQPIFLLNDICRFWKTLLLNYENKRNRSECSDTEKIKQKVKNFKLKFSRMTTCFATISALGSYNAPVSEEQIVELIYLTPRERLQDIAKRIPGAQNEVKDVLKKYAWFIEMTGLTTDKLQSFFYDKQKRAEMFSKANDYGNSMFRLLQKLDDETGGNNGLLRYLVI